MATEKKGKKNKVTEKKPKAKAVKKVVKPATKKIDKPTEVDVMTNLLEVEVLEKPTEESVMTNTLEVIDEIPKVEPKKIDHTANRKKMMMMG